MAGETTIHLCYCQIPVDKLRNIARRRFVEGIPTNELMKQMKSQKEKDYLTTIALLNVKLEDLPQLIPHDNPMLLRHLLDCRDHVKYLLEVDGIKIDEPAV